MERRYKTYYDRKKQLRRERNESGLCAKCGRRAVKAGAAQCDVCNRVGAEKQKVRRDRLREQGVCTVCGRNPATETNAKCESCQALEKDSKRKRADQFKSARLCERCGKAEPVEQSQRCETCLFKRLSSFYLGGVARWRELKQLLDVQGCVCPYLGLPISIGSTAWLDHRVPQAKGGTSDIGNLQFVHVWANVMKLDLDEDEFLAMLDKALPTIMAKRNLHPRRAKVQVIRFSQRSA